MLIPARTFIASPDSDALEKALLQDPAFHCLGSARDGRDALPNILSFSPDLLILDSMLPGMDGFSLLKQLQKKPFHAPQSAFSLPAERKKLAGKSKGNRSGYRPFLAGRK